MYNIISQSANLPTRVRYNMTCPNARSKRVKDLVGQTVNPEYWVLYEKDAGDGHTKKVFAFTLPDGALYATISASFIDSILSMIECIGVDFGAFTIVSAHSKAGREFIFPVLADSVG